MSKFLNNINSKKFIVFLMGSIFFSIGLLNQNGWLVVAGIYASANVLNKLIEANKIGLNVSNGGK